MAGESPMNLRRKLVLIFALTVFLSVAAVGSLVLALTRHAFEKNEAERTAALVTQFQHEFARQGDEITRRIEAIAASEPVSRMAALISGTAADSAGNFDLARSLAESYQLDFLDLVNERGLIISSAQTPAKFGYPENAFDSVFSGQPNAFLMQEEFPDSTELVLLAVRTAHAADHAVYVIGGRQLDKSFLSALDLPANTRALLYFNRRDHFSLDQLIDPYGNESVPQNIVELIQSVRQYNQETSGIVRHSTDQADDEVFHAIPLRGIDKDHGLLGILLIGNSRRPYVELKRRIRDSALLVAGLGIVLAILLSSWAAGRVTRPVEQLAQAAQDVATGNWSTRVEVVGKDEIGQLAEAFNHMTSQLLAQRDRLVQAERVAAWRELARRLAHELKNPLFPLQITVENLLRARTQSSELFNEVLDESGRTMLAEIANLKTIIGRFSDFSKMPAPHLQPVQVNEILRDIVRLYRAQFDAPGHVPITAKLELDDPIEPISADPELLHRAVSNLVLNAMDAMPNGGTLTLRNRVGDRKITIEVSDTGTGLTREECERIFTPYYTSKQRGTGLGLAIVQSVISDHGGTIAVQSEPGRGTTFLIELPRTRSAPERSTSSEQERTVPVSFSG
jgi:two-component system, NtrC family, nitrogen regulation sensor histidine kinase NtrY